MAKITFMGAGSTIFAKSILGDSMCSQALRDSHIALYDIDRARLSESLQMLEAINRNINEGRAKVTTHLGVKNRRAALKGANYVVNAIQVGGYEPSTVIDFEVPKKYGLRQTIADTLGIGGIFRALRTIPVVLDFARDMEAVCPDAWFLNYVNPMAMITGSLLQGSGVKAVGLCHSVQGCADGLLRRVEMHGGVDKLNWKIAGINHQAWLLEITDGGRDLYPEIKRRAARKLRAIRKRGAAKVAEELRARAQAEGREAWECPDFMVAMDMVRLTLMLRLGHYITESSEHASEYLPWFIKGTHPELIDEFNIPLDEYPRRCVSQIKNWKKSSEELVKNPSLGHTRGHEFGSYIMEAIETGKPIRVHGNVMNTGLITNLPRRACVEVPCLVDRNGVQGCYVGDLPEVCAAVNMTNVNVQILAIDAALTRKRDLVYQAAMMDPHTAAELTIDQIVAMCDELIEAHGAMLPKYR
ncbi:MAG: alpha-glucosidase/alpha-galactosidase [Lentisphaerae bacterium]|nr:alpha-glucosidase/alpha-galactosidase [Lentisphaerota bacterium]